MLEWCLCCGEGGFECFCLFVGFLPVEDSDGVVVCVDGFSGCQECADEDVSQFCGQAVVAVFLFRGCWVVDFRHVL